MRKLGSRSLVQFLGLSLLTWLSVPGCGKAPAPTPVVVAERPRAIPAAKPPPPPPPPPSPLEGADPSDVFDEAQPLPNFEITGLMPPIDTSEFLAAAPVDGVDSSRFTVVSGNTVSLRNGSSGGMRLPPGFRAADGTDYSVEGLPLRIVCERDSSEMVLVPAGSVRMGHDAGPADSRPSVMIEVSPFYIDLHEVTLRQFNEFRSSQSTKIAAALNEGESPRRPAVGVTWNDARESARWAGKELPTEAEWERAARGPNSWRTPWGEGRAVWERSREPGQIDDVASFVHDRSRFGLFDVAGNAREWCADHFSSKSFSEVVVMPQAKRKDWTGAKQPSRPNLKVVKGGAADWSLWQRTGVEMRERAADIGFRCVLRSKKDAS